MERAPASTAPWLRTRLAVEASVSYAATVDPDLLTIGAAAWHGRSPTRIEAAILSEIEKLVHTPPAADEMATVRKQVRTQVAYASDGVANLGFNLGAFEVASSYHDYLAMIDNVGRVTAEDVQRVAATYLTEMNRTVGWFVPSDDGGGPHE